MSPRRRLWWSDGRFRAFRGSSFGLSFRMGTSFVARRCLFSISLQSFFPDNISVFEVGADHYFEQCWNGCYIQANKILISPSILVDLFNNVKSWSIWTRRSSCTTSFDLINQHYTKTIRRYVTYQKN